MSTNLFRLFSRNLRAVFNCSQTNFVAIILVLLVLICAIFCSTAFLSDAFDFSTSKAGYTGSTQRALSALRSFQLKLFWRLILMVLRAVLKSLKTLPLLNPPPPPPPLLPPLPTPLPPPLHTTVAQHFNITNFRIFLTKDANFFVFYFFHYSRLSGRRGRKMSLEV